MGITACFLLFIISATGVNITEPVDGETYNGDWLTVRAIVENENEIPEYVQYSLNGQPVEQIPRLNTDWYTYMQNDLHHGYSESPAPTDNTILWTAPVTGPSHEFCSPVIVNGVVYFVSDWQSIAYALDALTGEILWQYDVVDHVDDAVTWFEDKVYIAADSAWCLNAITGERVWSFKPSPAYKMNGSPALGDGVAYFSFAPNSGSLRVYALNAETGEEIWVKDISSYSTGCITLFQDRLFVPTYNGKLYALDTFSGQIIWENSDSPLGYWDSSPVVVDSVIYISGSDGKTRAIDAITGITVWEVQLASGEITATPAYHDGRLYFADPVDTYHCLDALGGSTLWTAAYTQHGSSAIADGLVFFGDYLFNDSAKVVALDCITGETVWTYITTANRFQGSPAITDGVVYIAATDWNLYAFGTGLKYTYLDDLFAEVGSNELIVTSFDEGVPVAADTVSFTVTGTGINLEPSHRLGLCVNPNPFHSSASISFELSEPGYTSIEVYDLSGRMVSVLESAELTAGEHSIQWNGSSQNGEPVSAGLYFCRIQSGSITETTGLCLLR